MRRAAVVFLLLFASPLLADETGNLVTLAKVWAAVKYLDPALESSNVDWDAAVMRAMPAVRAAKSDDELAHAVDVMLQELHDPATRVAAKSTAHRSGADAELFRRDGDILIVNAAQYVAQHGEEAAYAAAQKLAPEVMKAKRVVVDLRAGGDDDVAESAAGVLYGMPWSPADLQAPAYHYTFHSGYAPQNGASSGGYFSGFLTAPGATLRAARGTPPERWIFVTDASSQLSDTILALHDGGRAIIVSSAPIGDSAAGVTRTMPLAAKWSAHVRVAQLDTEIAADVIDPDPMTAATALARGEKTLPPASAPAKLPEAGRFRPESAYPGAFPDTEHRILAAFRLWSVIHYFYPYLQLIGDWDAAFAESLPRFMAAKNEVEYAQAAMALDAHVEDGHSGVYGRAVYEAILPGVIPVDVGYIGNEVVIFDPLAVADLHKGDVIISIDGEGIADRVARLRPYVTASTERARADRVAGVALRGKVGQPATLEIRDAKGTHRVTVTRVMPAWPADSKEPAFMLLTKDIGYADLKRLEVVDVDAMFDAFAKTKAIVLDMRGYPRGTAWAIAPRINTKKATVGAQFRRRQVSGSLSREESASGFFFEQPLPQSDKPLYTGRVIVLIDDRAISQSEHSCLFFEAANGATFIGSATAGANGDVTNFPLPGELSVYFTGHDVRHADGRQLQRVGIQPTIAIEPTIAGLRAGRDEVLERAIQFVNRGR